MTFAFGGQRSIQLSYGCLVAFIAHATPVRQWPVLEQRRSIGTGIASRKASSHVCGPRCVDPFLDKSGPQGHAIGRCTWMVTDEEGNRYGDVPKAE